MEKLEREGELNEIENYFTDGWHFVYEHPRDAFNHLVGNVAAKE